MLHLFHGENIESSRKELNLLKEAHAGGEIINLNGATISITDLYQAIESNTMFVGKRLIIIENYLKNTVRKKTPLNESFLSLIKQIPSETEVVFWEEKKIPKIILSEFPKKSDIALFEFDRLIFNFVDSIYPKNTEDLLHKLDAVIKNDAPEMLFVMMVRQFRLMIMSHDLDKNIPDMSPWQAAKITKQAKLFEYTHLLKLYNDLLQIDLKIKTSSGAFNLTDELKLFLIKI